ncbi:MAG: prepilin-type N-terminal cleavage/methylation domain-containing protein [Lachnospiraceae bacterium]|nr:prepilin-type N-terminal cleavage/methylation domain-containing protein [Lachnospiraceae bacterium]
MSKTQKHNQGFSFIELLIALTILSIVMIMVVQFMGTSTAAYQKNKSNLNLQNEAMQVLEQMSDTLMQAKYVRVVTKDKGMYLIEHKDSDGDGDKERVISTPTTYTPVTFDFVPDNYGNYAKCSDFTTSDRKVIVDFDTFEIVNEKKKTYPLISSPTDNDVVYTDLNGNKTIMLASQSVRSFRALKNGTVYNYIKPEFIYAEYSTSNKKTVHVIYHITDVTDSRDNTCSIYMYRYETDDTNPTEAKVKNYNYARTQVMGLLGKGYETTKYSANTDTFVTNKESATALQAIKDGAQGMITGNISDFYLSADSEGNAILTNIMFKDGNYTYNTVETINFRNSNVLTVRPQKLYKLVN